MPRLPATHVDDPKKVGRRLKEARQRAGLSQRSFSFPGCTSAYISRIESGERTPSLQLLHEFARRLRVSPRYLATGVEDRDEDSELLDAEVALRLGELDQAREIYLRRLNSHAGDPVALAGLGEIALAQDELPEAVDLLEQALEARDGRLLENPSSVESLARAHALTGAIDSAIALLVRAVNQAEQADAIVEVFRFRILLANALIDNGQLGRAERMLAESIGLAEELRDPFAKARVYWSQSRLHTPRDPSLGARYAQRAITILERTENDAYLAKAYHLLAYAEIEAGNADLAMQHLERGRAFFGEALMPRDDAKFAIEETRALLALGRVKEAAQRAAEAYATIDALDPQDRGRAYMLFGDVFQMAGDEERALALFERALTLLETAGKPYLLEAASRLAELLERSGNPERALAVLKGAVTANRATALDATDNEHSSPETDIGKSLASVPTRAGSQRASHASDNAARSKP